MDSTFELVVTRVDFWPCGISMCYFSQVPSGLWIDFFIQFQMIFLVAGGDTTRFFQLEVGMQKEFQLQLRFFFSYKWDCNWEYFSLASGPFLVASGPFSAPSGVATDFFSVASEIFFQFQEWLQLEEKQVASEAFSVASGVRT
jgi:hypothetical protein